MGHWTFSVGRAQKKAEKRTAKLAQQENEEADDPIDTNSIQVLKLSGGGAERRGVGPAQDAEEEEIDGEEQEDGEEEEEVLGYVNGAEDEGEVRRSISSPH